MLFKDNNHITRNYYLNLFSANADIIKNGNNNFMYEWNIRDLQLGKYAEIALVQLASINADYTPDRQYPPKAFNSRTGDTTTSTNILNKTTVFETITLNTDNITYGSGTYEIYSSSRVNTTEPMYKALLFNYTEGDAHGALWQNLNYTDGVYNGGNFIVSDYTGDWIVIKFPSAIVLTKFNFILRVSAYVPDTYRTPAEWKCYGSNDGINFTEIKEGSNLNRLTLNDYVNRVYTKTVNSKIAYLYIGFVINKTLPGATQLNFKELQIFGKEELNIRNPVIWYKFDGSSTNMLLDSSGNNYHLTNNGATFDASNFKRGYGSSAYNHVSNQFLTIPSINLYNIQSKKGITFSLWFRMNTTNTGVYPRIFDFNNGSSSTPRWIIISRHSNNNKLNFHIANSANLSENRITTNDYIDGNWHHIVWIINNVGKWDVYIDGVIASFTAPLPTNFNIENITFNNNFFGKSLFSSDGFLSGNIDDFRIYDYVLTANEVLALYNGSELTTQNKYIIRSLNTYDDGYDSINTTSAILFAGNKLTSPSNPTYHKLNTYNLNRISLQVSNDINENKPYNGWDDKIQFGAVFHIKDYKQD